MPLKRICEQSSRTKSIMFKDEMRFGIFGQAMSGGVVVSSRDVDTANNISSHANTSVTLWRLVSVVTPRSIGGELAAWALNLIKADPGSVTAISMADRSLLQKRLQMAQVEYQITLTNSKQNSIGVHSIDDHLCCFFIFVHSIMHNSTLTQSSIETGARELPKPLTA